MDQGIVHFQKAYSPAPDITPADASALGSLPTSAFRYCEPVRTASAFGWYVYPPKDIQIHFDGREIFHYDEDQWYPVKTTPFEDEFRRAWDLSAPEDMKGMDPPFLSELFGDGFLQIWSGYFITTRQGYCSHIRPLANIDHRSSYSVYEGIVETDRFRPLPLFINIRLLSTDREIFIPKHTPLFQVQVLPRALYTRDHKEWRQEEAFASGTPGFDWGGYRTHLRERSKRDERKPGTYAVSVRKRGED